LVQKLRREGGEVERRQLRNLLVICAIGLGAVVDVLPLLGFDPPPVGWLPLLMAASGLLLIIVRHQLLDIRMAMRRVIWWLAGTFGGALAFFLGLRAALSLTGWRGRLELALLLAVTVLGMRLWLSSVQAWLDRMVGRRRRDWLRSIAAWRRSS
jgi:hypothetical protein